MPGRKGLAKAVKTNTTPIGVTENCAAEDEDAEDAFGGEPEGAAQQHQR